MPTAKRQRLTLLPGQCSIWIAQRIREGPLGMVAALRVLRLGINASPSCGFIASPTLYVYGITGNADIVLSLLILNPYTELAFLTPRLNVCLDLSMRALAKQISHEPKNIQEYGRSEGEEIGCDFGWPSGGRKNFGPVINLIPYGRNEIFADRPIALKHFSVRPIEDFSITVVLGVLGGEAAYRPGGPQLALALAWAEPLLDEPGPGQGRGN